MGYTTKAAKAICTTPDRVFYFMAVKHLVIIWERVEQSHIKDLVFLFLPSYWHNGDSRTQPVFPLWEEHLHR